MYLKSTVHYSRVNWSFKDLRVVANGGTVSEGI